MRAVLLAAVAAAVVLAGAGCGNSGPSTPTYPVNVYVANQHVAAVPLGHPATFLPSPLRISLGIAKVVVNIPPDVATRLVDDALSKHAGRVDLPFTPVSSFMALSTQHALFHHDSEATALSMLLQGAGLDAPQVALVPKMARSGPPTPQRVHGKTQWGDPELGFVGKPNAPGPRGGFGVYEPPIVKLARSYGIHLIDVQGKSTKFIRHELLHGHPIMAWVGAPGGQTASWVTPSGKTITVNSSEEAVTLVGAGPGYVLLNDPLTGKQRKWSDAQFAARWALIGNRALELP